MLDFFIKVLLFQTLFLAVYDLFLKRETFFQWNRAYLMTTSVLAYLVPLVKIDRVREMVPQEYAVVLPEVVLNPTATIAQSFDWAAALFLVLKVVFWIGAVLAGILFAVRLYKIVKLIVAHEKEFKPNYCLVWLKENTAFSFFNYIFLGRESDHRAQIIEHELVHVNQKHSLDLVFFELQKIVFWFNPYSYLYQARIAELHEFIADAKTVKHLDRQSYFNNLLSETFGVKHLSFINPFIKHSLIKKRIIMLNKKKSRQILKLKYVLLLPILAGMLAYTSCEKNDNISNEEISLQKSSNGKYEDEEYIRERLDSLFNELKRTRGITDENSKIIQEIADELYKYSNIKRAERKMEVPSIPEKVEVIPLSEIELSEGIPFALINQAPVFPDCEDAEDQKRCLQESIQKHVARNFNTNLTKGLGLAPGRKRIIAVFKIDENGNITDVRSRGPHKDLEAEAIRVITDLPKMQPGEHGGKKVGVKYTLPITLMVDGPDNGEN